MIFKTIGVVMIVIGCGAFGFSMAAADLHKTYCFKKMIAAIENMARELEYRNLALPELCRNAASVSGGVVASIFASLADEMEAMLSTDVKSCIKNVLQRDIPIPEFLVSTIEDIGNSLGKFDREIQLNGLASVASELESELNLHVQGQGTRLRSYQTLGLCAGAAIVILII